jgi:hypothetical protein
MYCTVWLFTGEWKIWTYYSILQGIIRFRFLLMIDLSTLYSRSIFMECLPNLLRLYFGLNLDWKLHSLGLNLNCITRLSRKIFQNRVLIEWLLNFSQLNTWGGPRSILFNLLLNHFRFCTFFLSEALMSCSDFNLMVLG